MNAVHFLVAAAFVHCSLFFFNMIFRSCSHYPYHLFMENTGLEIKTFTIKWFGTVFNRLLVKWGMDRSKFLIMWFNVGAVVSIFILPVASFMLIKMIFINIFQYGSHIAKEEAREWVLEPMVPGVNIPFSDIQYYVITLGLCSIVHECGHALAASREDIQIFGVGLILVYIVPVAYVSLNSEQLSQLPMMNQLRILCAGVWHNIVLAVFAAFVFMSSSWFWSPLYHVGSGVTVESMHTNSPLLGPTGLRVHDTIYRINECPISDSDDWYHCILETIKRPTPGYCIAKSIIEEYDESIPAWTMADGTINCCRPDSEMNGYLCFEYIEGSMVAPLQLPPNSCLPARTIVEKSYRQCKSSRDCSKLDTYCMKPEIENTTKIVQIKRNIGKDVLFIGYPSQMYRTMEISDWVPKFSFLSSKLPEYVVLLSKYITVLSSGLAMINIIPCFYFDGHHIITTLTDHLLRSKIRHRSLRQAVGLTITSLGSLVLIVNVIHAFVKK